MLKKQAADLVLGKGRAKEVMKGWMIKVHLVLYHSESSSAYLSMKYQVISSYVVLVKKTSNWINGYMYNRHPNITSMMQSGPLSVAISCKIKSIKQNRNYTSMEKQMEQMYCVIPTTN